MMGFYEYIRRGHPASSIVRNMTIKMAYKVIASYPLYMPSCFWGTFTEYPYTGSVFVIEYFYALIVYYVICNCLFQY